MTSLSDLPAAAHATPHPTRGLLMANLLCMASMFAWATGLPAAEIIIPLLPSDQLAALRISIAAVTLLPVWLLLDGLGALRQVAWLRGLAIGGLIGLSAWFIIIGQTLAGPVTAAVITASMPIIGIAIEVVCDGRKLTAAVLVGLVLAVIGGVMALDYSSGGLTLGLGALVCLASFFCYVLGSRLIITRMSGTSIVGRTAVTLIGAALTMLIIAGIKIGMGAELPDLRPWGLREWGAMAMFAVFGMTLCQVLWLISVKELGIGMSSLHSNAAPFYVMLIMTLGFAAPWSWMQAAAALVVGLGVIIAQGVIKLPKAAARRVA